MSKLCHFEIPTTDHEKSVVFYNKIFGWKTNYIPEMDYTLFEIEDGIGGGFSKQLKVTKEPGVLIYLEVENIENTLSEINNAGGKTIKGKSEIPNIGWDAIFIDIMGNAIGLYQSK